MKERQRKSQATSTQTPLRQKKKKKRKQTCSLFIGIYYANIIFPAIDMSTAVVKQYMMRMKNTQIAALQPVQ